MSQKSTDTETTSTIKPYKGEIHKPEITMYPKAMLDQAYPDLKDKHLYILVRGIPKGHPEFVNFIHTSLIVKYDEKTGDIETLNSRYKLIGDVKIAHNR